jgi:FMN phosphatase YigB (HAD superfamily)
VLTGITTVTFDFGNTLVPVDRAGLGRVVRITAGAVADRCGPFSEDAFLTAWAEERGRQFAEEVPRFREVDLGQRVVRVLARLRGMAAPGPGRRWDDAAAAARSSPEERAFVLDEYSRAFVDAIPPPPEIARILGRLASTRRLAVLSNWPLAITIDRYVEAAGWRPHLAAVVVSERVGAIKPHPRIFRAAETALGGPSRTSILHVGDDWVADVVGARGAGWRAGYLRSRPADSPLPSSERTEGVTADVELDSLTELVGLLGPD